MTSPRLKICRVQSRLCIGGPAHHTMLLSSRVDPDRYETLLIGGSSGPGELDLHHKAEALGIRTIRIPEMRRVTHPGNDAIAFTKLVRVFRKERPTIVHTHTAKAGALGRLAARVCGVPVVVHTFHGHVLDGYFHPWVSGCFRLTERLLARMTDRIVVVSESQRREISEVHHVADPRKIEVIRLGLDLRRYSASTSQRGMLRHELGLSRSDNLIGWVGRFAEVKDPLLFLRACSRLPTEMRNASHFVLVGDGELRLIAEMESARLGLGNRTHFLGYRQDLDRIYADLDLFVLTSRNEGTPVTMIEAMSAGLPVVAPAVGGVADVARGYPSATILDERTDESFAAAMGRLLSRPPGRANGGPVAGRYGAERLVREIETLYDHLLEERWIKPELDPQSR